MIIYIYIIYNYIYNIIYIYDLSIFIIIYSFVCSLHNINISEIKRYIN